MLPQVPHWETYFVKSSFHEQAQLSLAGGCTMLPHQMLYAEARFLHVEETAGLMGANTPGFAH